MALELDAVLRELHTGGFSVLAADIADLQPQKNEGTPGVQQLQQRYARVPSSPLSAAFSGSLVTTAPLPQHQQVQVVVTFDLVQAPSAFSLPVMQKRVWDPPFQIRMTWRSTLPLQFSTTVAAFVVDESAVTSMLSWQFPHPQEAGRQLLDHQQERMVVLAPHDVKGEGSGDLDCPSPHFAEAVFTFNKLQFGQPSQMRPRWLVFAGSLFGGGCVYTHYKVPTVVMSRLAEQFDKAKKLLWGGVEPACDSSVMKMDYKQLRKYIKRELQSIDVQREPTEDDYRYLASKAGFVVASDSVRGTSATLEELAAFKQWFGGHLVMLKHVRQHYERLDPQVVCGFWVTREHADALLMPHPKGAFLLRFGSQGGQLVLSVRSGGCGARGGGGSPITHYILTGTSLQNNGLEALLERNNMAVELLDAVTGQRHLRTVVLDRSYLQAVDLMEVKKRYRHASDEVQSSPSPSGDQMPCSLYNLSAGGASMSMSLGHTQQQPQQQQQHAAQLQQHAAQLQQQRQAVQQHVPPQRHQQHHLEQQQQQHLQQQQQQPQVYQTHGSFLQQQQQQASGAVLLAGGGSMQMDYADGRAGSGDPTGPGPAAAPQGSEGGGASGGGAAAAAAAHNSSLLTAAAAYNPYCGSSLMMRPGGPPFPPTTSALPMGVGAAGNYVAWPVQGQFNGMAAAGARQQQPQQMGLGAAPFNWGSPGLVPLLAPGGGSGNGGGLLEQQQQAVAAAAAAAAMAGGHMGSLQHQQFPLPILGSSSAAAGPAAVLAASLPQYSSASPAESNTAASDAGEESASIGQPPVGQRRQQQQQPSPSPRDGSVVSSRQYRHHHRSQQHQGGGGGGGDSGGSGMQFQAAQGYGHTSAAAHGSLPFPQIQAGLGGALLAGGGNSGGGGPGGAAGGGEGGHGGLRAPELHEVLLMQQRWMQAGGGSGGGGGSGIAPPDLLPGSLSGLQLGGGFSTEEAEVAAAAAAAAGQPGGPPPRLQSSGAELMVATPAETSNEDLQSMIADFLK